MNSKLSEYFSKAHTALPFTIAFIKEVINIVSQVNTYNILPTR